MKELKVIVIDVEKKEFRESPVSTLEDMQKIVGGYICLAGRLPNGDEIYVDDDGRLKAQIGGFITTGMRMPMVGNGFIIGAVDDDGENTDVEATVKYLEHHVKILVGVR